MPKFLRFILLLIFSSWVIPQKGIAQEHVAPILNGASKSGQNGVLQKPTQLTLPFFEDFTDYGQSPDPAKWKDQSVYLSNTMPVGQHTRGVAVFDANNDKTIPYDTLNPNHQIWGDSLTSMDFDLSSYTPQDSIYLSFYYEPQGNGFSPKPTDSLILFFKNSQDKWVRVWGRGRFDTFINFRQVIVPVLDTGYLYNGFSFRFINKATHGLSNSEWMLDYVFMNSHRNPFDTALQELAATRNPTNMLNDFTAMPFSHFQTNPGSFLASKLIAYFRNNSSASQNLNFTLQSKELFTGYNFGNQVMGSTAPPYQETTLDFNNFSFSGFSPSATSDGKVIIENKYFSPSIYPNESKVNDTIVQDQVFDNYFAYDDGTAEQAYFLNTFPDAPAITAIEFALFHPDTVRGIEIYFPRTVPSSDFKEFSLIIYKTIAVDGNLDTILYQQDFNLPSFQDSVNKYSVYNFNQPVAVGTGTFYVGIMQSAGGFSDSLYLGLDVNRIGGNHRYFNVEGLWQSSSIDGAVMVRPLVGSPLPPTEIHPITKFESEASVYPNPNGGIFTVMLAQPPSVPLTFKITDVFGRTLKTGIIKNEKQQINLAYLAPGVYFLQILGKEANQTLRIVKE